MSEVRGTTVVTIDEFRVEGTFRDSPVLAVSVSDAGELVGGFAFAAICGVTGLAPGRSVGLFGGVAIAGADGVTGFATDGNGEPFGGVAITGADGVTGLATGEVIC